MKTIVVSAVNLRKGGTLTILINCLSYLSRLASKGEYRIIALVHKKELVDVSGVDYIELPWSIDSWFNRLKCEYITMNDISKEIGNVYLWISLHDTSPRVKAKRQVVYCHNSFFAYNWCFKQLLFNYKIVLFACFTRLIYRFNIKSNYKIVVQQNWMKKAFLNMFNLDSSDIIVARPEREKHNLITLNHNEKKIGDVYRFIFASSPDLHKNFEQLCEAARLLENEIGKDTFKVMITVAGDENRYAKWLYEKWSCVSSIEFAGFMDKPTLYKNYEMADCMVFPSKVETWGLPITEFAAYERPILVADLPYAHETAAGCDKVSFFNPDSPQELMLKMKALVLGDNSGLCKVDDLIIESPIAHTWEELFHKLLQ